MRRKIISFAEAIGCYKQNKPKPLMSNPVISPLNPIIKINKIYNIFLDPRKQFFEVAYINAYPKNISWLYVRTCDDFMAMVAKEGCPKNISMCHNFNRAHEIAEDMAAAQGAYKYNNLDNKTGYHAIKWLISFCNSTKSDFPQIYLHETSSRFGCNNILKLITAYKAGLLEGKEELFGIIENPITTPPKHNNTQRIIIPSVFKAKEPPKINVTVFEA